MTISQRTARIGVILTGGMLLLTTAAQAQTIRFVKADATGNNNGTSWTDAYKYLQDALSEASGGTVDEIWVAAGTYRPDEDTGNPTGSGERTATFQLINAVAVYGGFGGTETTLGQRAGLFDQTILSGDIPGANSFHVVTGSATDETAILDGFTITGGDADTPPMDSGGGMRNVNGCPTVMNCTFSENSSGYWGGGMYNWNSSPTVTNCRFINNSSEAEGGGMRNFDNSSPVITNCIFAGNHSDYDGGGMHNQLDSDPELRNCVFSGNSADVCSGGIQYDYGGTPAIINCTFTYNWALGEELDGCKGGGGVLTFNTDPVIENCVFWGNMSTFGTDEEQQIGYYTGHQYPGAQVSHSSIDTGGAELYWYAGNGNINADPLLFDANGADDVIGTEDDDVHLQAASPCVDTGHNPGVPSGLTTDLDGNRRMFDGLCSDAATVDMGVYEYQADPPCNNIKNRYISFYPFSADDIVAVQMTLTSMKRCSGMLSWTCDADGDCPMVCTNDNTHHCVVDAQCEPGGVCTVPTSPCVEHPDVVQSWWLSEPFDPSCQTGPGAPPTGPCNSTNYVARVVDTPVYRVWAEPFVHIGDCEIVPAAAYELRATPDGLEFSSPLVVETVRKPGALHYGDVVGVGTGDLLPLPGFTPPQGVVNVTDIQAYKQTFQGSSSPSAHPTWVDLHGLADGSPPNFIVNIADLQRIKFAFLGLVWTDTPGQFTPGQCPADNNFTPPSGDPTVFTLQSDSEFIGPADPLNVDVFIGPTADLGGYEVALEVTGGTSGELLLESITIDSSHPDYVFAGKSNISSAFDTDGERMSTSLQDEGVEVVASGYLATFTYQPSGGAYGVFNIVMKPGYDVAILNDSQGVLLPLQTADTEVIGVGIDCIVDADCDNIPCQTAACTNYECSYTSIAQGTPCDDGQFCTATDECDGNGTCVGSGTPCWSKFPQCCEDNNICICTSCTCPPMP